MNAYLFFTWAMMIIGLVTCPWPLTVPLAALAYKVRLGNRPVPMPPGELWLRSAFAALGLAVLTAVLFGLEWLFAGFLEFPRGPVVVVVFLLYLPVAVAYFFWIFAYDEMVEAIGTFLVYVLLPGLPLLLLLWVTGFGRRIQEALAREMPALKAALPTVERFLT